MKAKIVFFIQNFSRAGGSERAVSLVANELDRRGYHVCVLSICGDNTCFFKLRRTVELYTLVEKKDVNNKTEFLKIVNRLNTFYKKNDVDICIDVFASLSIYTLLMKNRYKLKNITWEHYNYLNNMGMNKIGRQLAMKMSNAIITLTETDRKYYITNNMKINKQKIFAIYNATPYPNAEYKKQRKKIIISIGRLEKLKGFDQLLDVWSRICSKYPEWKLLILGEGEERINLERLIDVNNIQNVKLVGKISDVSEYYQNASIYVSTSEREGLPMTMIEAQSFGVPIVSFDYETGPKDIIHEGYDGFIISQGEERNNNMAKKVSELIDNPSELLEISRNAKLSSKRFDISRIADDWENVIVNLLKES